MHAANVLGLVTVLVWVYLALGRASFWRVRVRQADRPAPPSRVAVVVPARNEAEVITRSVSSLLQQQHVTLHVFVVDDNSSDRTAQIARSISDSNRLTVISGKPLPDGWSGKLWALHQGLCAAQKTAPDYYLFTDADIEHAPDNISRLISIAEEGPHDLTSFMVKLHCRTLPEKFLIPAFVFFFFKLYPPKLITDPGSETAGAAGGCILIRPSALHRSGGLEEIRGEVIDDCALAAQVKRTGGRIWLGLTDSASSIRPYRTFAEIGRIISRTAFNQFHHSTLLLTIAVLGLLLTYIAPIALLFSTHKLALVAGAVASALMIACYAPMVRFYRLNQLWTLTLPLAALFYCGASLHSAIQYWLGRGGQWKGRTQDEIKNDAGTVHAS
jgi:hopene-associated glycosyltransferase HpnB